MQKKEIKKLLKDIEWQRKLGFQVVAWTLTIVVGSYAFDGQRVPLDTTRSGIILMAIISLVISVSLEAGREGIKRAKRKPKWIKTMALFLKAQQLTGAIALVIFFVFYLGHGFL